MAPLVLGGEPKGLVVLLSSGGKEASSPPRTRHLPYKGRREEYWEREEEEQRMGIRGVIQWCVGNDDWNAVG